jgi:hypothetical protein
MDIIDMRLDLTLTHRSLDQLVCHAVVAFLFEDESRQKGYLSKINQVLAGSLTPLIERHFITGRRDEHTLIAPQKGIGVGKLLLVGLGPVGSYSGKTLSPVIKRLSSTLDRLKVNEFGIIVPPLEMARTDYKRFVRTMIRNLVNYYMKSKMDSVDFSLRLLVSIDEQSFSQLHALEQSLSGYLDPHLEYTIVIEDSRGSGNEKV